VSLPQKYGVVAPSLDISRTLKEARQEFERGYIARVLGECKGNIARTAERLDLARQFLHQKLKSLGIENVYKNEDQ